jgi:hypothetical protein
MALRESKLRLESIENERTSFSARERPKRLRSRRAHAPASCSGQGAGQLLVQYFNRCDARFYT